MHEAQTTIPEIRLFLQAELVRRCKANPKYSLRAFAKLLGVESSALSKILNGKRSVSAPMLKKIARRLALSPSLLQTLEGQVVERRGRHKESANIPTPFTPNYQQLTLDHFQIISDWYHYAILELIAVEGFQPKLSWISRSLGISVAEAQAAVERLQRLDYLEISSDGKWIDCAGHVTNIKSDFTTTAHRKLQEQILAKAITAIEEVPLELRDNTGMTMAIDQDLIPEARKRITAFRRELCALLQSGKKKNAVYQLGIALYPVTKTERFEIRKKKEK
jgi:uncharacterized protein (TIGR02147 family)